METRISLRYFVSYCSIEVANWLLERNMTTVGTVLKNRVGIPPQVFDTKNCKLFSKTFHFEKEKKDLYLTSYTVQSKSKGKKNIVILATPSPLYCSTKDDQKSNPQIFKFYGTDFCRPAKLLL